MAGQHFSPAPLSKKWVAPPPPPPPGARSFLRINKKTKHNNNNNNNNNSTNKNFSRLSMIGFWTMANTYCHFLNPGGTPQQQLMLLDGVTGRGGEGGGAAAAAIPSGFIDVHNHHQADNNKKNNKSIMLLPSTIGSNQQQQRRQLQIADESFLDDDYNNNNKKPLFTGTSSSLCMMRGGGATPTTTTIFDEFVEALQNNKLTQLLLNNIKNDNPNILGHLKILLPVACLIRFLLVSSSSSSSSSSLSSSSSSSSPSTTSSTKRRYKILNRLGIAFQHFIRDSGLFGTLIDTLVLIGLPTIAKEYPTALKDYQRLGKKLYCTRINYGKQSKRKQILDMYLPPYSSSSSTSSSLPPDDDDYKEEDSLDDNKTATTNTARGLVFFVHGGAWGSGYPSMYRLAANQFLKRGIAVAVIGYRTYPTGNVMEQAIDCELAAAELVKLYPQLCLGETELGVTAIGHSSGGHILGLMLVERLRRHERILQQQQQQHHSGGGNQPPRLIPINNKMMRIDNFFSVSAPLDVARHYEFETARGVVELSPMTPACGGKSQFDQHTPALLLRKILSRYTPEEVSAVDAAYFPRIAFLHGVEDDSVPMESSQRAAKTLRLAGVTKCDEFYFSSTGHHDTLLEIMFGGKTFHTIYNWMEANSKKKESSSSRLCYFNGEETKQVLALEHAPSQ